MLSGGVFTQPTDERSTIDNVQYRMPFLTNSLHVAQRMNVATDLKWLWAAKMNAKKTITRNEISCKNCKFLYKYLLVFSRVSVMLHHHISKWCRWEKVADIKKKKQKNMRKMNETKQRKKKLKQQQKEYRTPEDSSWFYSMDDDIRRQNAKIQHHFRQQITLLSHHPKCERINICCENTHGLKDHLFHTEFSKRFTTN